MLMVDWMKNADEWIEDAEQLHMDRRWSQVQVDQPIRLIGSELGRMATSTVSAMPLSGPVGEHVPDHGPMPMLPTSNEPEMDGLHPVSEDGDGSVPALQQGHVPSDSLLLCDDVEILAVGTEADAVSTEVAATLQEASQGGGVSDGYNE